MLHWNCYWHRSSLHHPNIVLFLGACLETPHLCLVLEHCVHGSLHEFLRSEHKHRIKINMSLVYRFAVDIARAVKYLHNKQHIVQRDLKARNILVDASLNPKVSDFGLSLEVQASGSDSHLTACGTPAWTAPEIIRGERYSDKVDVYSFAIVLWELIARTEPYGGKKGVAVAYAAAEQGARPDIPSFSPPQFTTLMRECWADQPDDRPTFATILARLFAMKKQADSIAKRYENSVTMRVVHRSVGSNGCSGTHLPIAFACTIESQSTGFKACAGFQRRGGQSEGRVSCTCCGGKGLATSFH